MMLYKRTLSMLIVLLMASVCSAFTEESDTTVVRVTGSGDTKQTAIDEALDGSLEKAYGRQVFVATGVTGGDYMIESDLSVSSGTVLGYKVLQSNRYDDREWVVTLEVKVSDNDILGEFDYQDNAWATRISEGFEPIESEYQIARIKRKRSRNEEILENFVPDADELIKDVGYHYSIDGFEVENIDGQNKAYGTYKVEILVNEPWWASYYGVIGQAESVVDDSFDHGPLMQGSFMTPKPSKSTAINSDFEGLVAPAMPVKISVGRAVNDFIVLGHNCVYAPGSIYVDESEGIGDSDRFCGSRVVVGVDLEPCSGDTINPYCKGYEANAKEGLEISIGSNLLGYERLMREVGDDGLNYISGDEADRRKEELELISNPNGINTLSEAKEEWEQQNPQPEKTWR